MWRPWKFWPWLPPGRQEILAIVVGIALVAAVVAAMIKFPSLGQNSNLGFGPDWDCVQLPKGGSVCMKKPPAVPPKSDAPAD